MTLVQTLLLSNCRRESCALPKTRDDCSPSVDLLNYCFVAGYIEKNEMLSKAAEIVKDLKECNPDIIYGRCFPKILHRLFGHEYTKLKESRKYIGISCFHKDVNKFKIALKYFKLNCFLFQ